MNDALDLQELVKLMKKWILLLLSITLLCIGGAGYASYNYITPIYEASTQVLITQQKNELGQFNSQDLQLNLQLINTYTVLLTGPAILSKVIEQLEMNTTPALLKKKIKVSNEQNSQVLNISVQDPNLEQAVAIANTTVLTFQEEIQTLMNVDNVKIIFPAVYVNNSIPVKPAPLLNMAIAAVIGLMIGVVVIFLLEHLNTTIKSEQDITELFNLPVLGQIGVIADKEIKTIKRKSNQKRRRKEGFRSV